MVGFARTAGRAVGVGSPVAWAAAAVLLAAVTALPAQALPRQPGFGRVLDKDGKPWVGAKVFLEHRSHPLVQDAAYVDRLEATTDERGQFRVEMLPASRYAAWARSGDIDEEDGSFRRSGVVSDAVSNTPFVLREAADPGVVHELQLVPRVGDTSWDEVAPRFVAIEDFGAFQRTTELRETGGYLFPPPSPDPTLTIGVFVGGFLAHELSVSTVLSADAADPLKVLPPLWQQVVLVQNQLGVGIAGARVAPLVPLPWESATEPVARSDDAGRVVRYYAGSRKYPPQSPHHRITARGYATRTLQNIVGPFGSQREGPRVLPGATNVRGRLLLRAGRPLGGVPLILDSKTRIQRGMQIVFGTCRLRTDADGTFVLPGREADLQFRVAAVLPLAVRAQLTRPDGYPVAPVALIRPARSETQENLGDLRVDELRTLDLRVRGPDGTPPGSVLIVWKPAPTVGANPPYEPLHLFTDHRGCVRLTAASFEGQVLVAVSKDGSVLHRLDADPADGPRKPGERQLELQLNPRSALRIQATFPDGSPAKGVRVALGVRRGTLEPALQQTVDELMDSRYFPLSVATTGPNGRATLVAPCAPEFCEVVFTPTKGYRHTEVPPEESWGDPERPFRIVVSKR